MTYPLGFRQEPDPRDDFYRLSTLMGVSPSRMPVSKSWLTGPVLDQKQTNGCVGYTCWQILASEPIISPLMASLSPDQIYLEARNNDEFPGNADEGTSVRAGLETLRRHGAISNYFWAENVQQILEYLLRYGPLVLGTDWYESMFEVDSHGFIDISGSIVGGHAYLAHAANWNDQTILCRTSWGPDAMRNGDFLMRMSDLEQLLTSGGVAAACLEA